MWPVARKTDIHWGSLKYGRWLGVGLLTWIIYGDHSRAREVARIGSSGLTIVIHVESPRGMLLDGVGQVTIATRVDRVAIHPASEWATCPVQCSLQHVHIGCILRHTPIIPRPIVQPSMLIIREWIVNVENYLFWRKPTFTTSHIGHTPRACTPCQTNQTTASAPKKWTKNKIK